MKAHIKQNLSSTRISSGIEPRHLHRIYQNRTDGLTLIPWAVNGQLLWDTTVVDSLALSRIISGVTHRIEEFKEVNME